MLDEVTGRTVLAAADQVAELSAADKAGIRGYDHGARPADDLINMNGRIFDARARRFVSADPIVAMPGQQHLNRYSYVANNPTNLTDPTGFLQEGESTATVRGSVPEG